MVTGAAWRLALWSAIARGVTAHVVMLRDVAILDDESAAALLTTIDGVQRGEPPVVHGSLELVGAFDERFDSLTAAGAAGGGRIARARHDLAAAAQRLVLRDHLLDLADAQNIAREALIDLAENHVFTLLPVWSENAPLQPTNFAHFLTGTIAPLGRAARRLHGSYEDLDRSPMGAAALAGPGLPVDRDETADLLGAEGAIESTFDALSATDHLVTAAYAASEAVTPMRRLLAELMLWKRTDPQALRLGDELLASSDPNLPHFRPPSALARIVTEARTVEELARTLASAASDIPYGPTGELTDRLAESAGDTLGRATGVSGAFSTMISGPIEINRAWLARNAGKALVTSGDLGDFLMAEEGLDPIAARDIAALTTRRAQEEGLEASGITPALIDAAALLIIGRELGIEVERLGAYLAPRRFIEKRQVLGGPAAPTVREYLQLERERLKADRRWLEEKRRRIALAAENLDIRVREILASAAG
jgi:argininosuccinate lyase